MGNAPGTYPVYAKWELDPARTALLVVDMQYHDAHPDYGFCLGMEKLRPGSMRYYNKRLEGVTVPAIRSLLDLFRSKGLTVVYLLIGSHYPDYRDLYPRYRNWQLKFEHDSGIERMLWDGSPLFRVRKEIAPRDDELVIMKRTYGAFASTNLEQILRNLAVESLVVTGVTTSACPETTAREAADRGFATVMVDDALADGDEERHRGSLASFESTFGGVLKDCDDVSRAFSGKTLPPAEATVDAHRK